MKTVVCPDCYEEFQVPEEEEKYECLECGSEFTDPDESDFEESENEE